MSKKGKRKKKKFGEVIVDEEKDTFTGSYNPKDVFKRKIDLNDGDDEDE